jgi:hypothetical protein
MSEALARPLVSSKPAFWASAMGPYNAGVIMVFTSSAPSIPVCRELVVSVDRQQDPATCVLANRSNLRVSVLLASYVAIGDEITFPVPMAGVVGTEIYVTKSSPSSGLNRCLYQAPIGYVTQPKLNKRNQHFVSAEVQQKALGISAILLPCGTLRDYFYRLPIAAGKDAQPNFYDTLRIPASASPAELRVAYKLRHLEVDGGTRSEQLALERAFNILGLPELRACYDALLADPEAPATFPYGGFGSLLVSGERSRDGQTFFAQRILAFAPERRRCRFHLPLRQCDFYEDRALCRDVRRKLEFWLDPALLGTLWDPTWNQWKHLLGAKMEVDATFIQSGKYRKRGGAWELVRWETALPSRLAVQLPADFQQQLETAKTTHHRFGQYSRALDQIRFCLEHRAIERTELERMCSGLGIPSGFDIAQINWRADYDPFFYRQLTRRARRIYLFRGEYIFDLEKAVVVETPQLGHATYVFAKPRSMEGFLALYTRITKEDIRRNRDNVGERLGFLGRAIHGTNARAWLKEMRQRLGEKMDFASAVAAEPPCSPRQPDKV